MIRRRRTKAYRRARLPLWAFAAAGLALGLCAALARGCAPAQEEPPAPEAHIRVYDHEAARVRDMALEEYLVGVVAAEMPASFASEALKAQAVAARTYALRRMTQDPCGRSGADICTDSACCQAYRRTAQLKENWGKSYAENLAGVTAAVTATAGEAAWYEGELIEALYHSSAGGRTEDAQHVFAAARPYLVSVESPGEEVSSAYAATVQVGRKDFVKAVNRQWKDAGLKSGSLGKQLAVLSRYASGRVERMRLGGVTATGREVRKLFSLNSANFTLTLTKNHVVFETLGYGHGVGMSQYGANAMAAQGSDYRDILTHYYPGVEIGPAPQKTP